MSTAITNKIVISKINHLLTLYSGTAPVKSYRVVIGDGGLGDKQVAGDHKTPEGSFIITEKLVISPPDQYLGLRWIRLSYPNLEAAERGLNSGLINQATHYLIVSAIKNGQTPPQNTPLGGGIGIHGAIDTHGYSDWTWGCIGMTNADVSEIYNFVAVGTPVVIQH